VRSACGAAAAGARGAHEAIFGQHLPMDGARASRVAAVLLWFGLLAVPVFAVDVARFHAATDFRCFYTAARMVASAEDPYDAGAWNAAMGGPAPDRRGIVQPPPCPGRFAYPLWTALLLLPLGLLPAAWSAAIWVTLLLGGALVGAMLTWRVVAPSHASPLGFLALVAASEPFGLTLANAQLGGLLFGLCGLVVWLGGRRRPSAGIALGLLAIKPHITFVTLAATWVWMSRRLRTATLTAGALLLALFLFTTLLRPAWPLEWLSELSAPERSAIAYNHATSWHLAEMLGLPAWAAVLVVGPLVAALGRHAIRPDAPLIHVVAASLVCGLVIAPYAGSYDQLLLAVAWGCSLAVARSTNGAMRRALVTALVTSVPLLSWPLFVISETLTALIPIATGVMLYLASRARRARHLSRT